MSNSRLDIFTDSPAVQVYTANYLYTPRKDVHGGPTLFYSPHSAVAIEQEGWIAAINNPEWGIDQICRYFAHVHIHYKNQELVILIRSTDGPSKDFSWSTTYKFSHI